jgi:hypothetical protein
MWTRGRFVQEYIPGLFTVAVDSFINKIAEGMYTYMVDIKESKKKREQDVGRSGLAYPAKKPEGTPITYDTQIAVPVQTWVHDVYALGIRITEEGIEDNLYELGGGGNAEDLQDMFYDLGESMAENLEIQAAKLLNYGTATTYHSTRFSTALFATTQYRADGTTFSNKSTLTDLTYETFWSILIAAENQTGYRQHKITKKVKGLWIPPQLEYKAAEILKSPDRPDTANRAINAYAQSGRSVAVRKWSQLTDPDAWFLQCEGRGLQMFWRRKTRFGREKDFQTGDIMCKADQRFSIEIADERDWYGVVPA